MYKQAELACLEHQHQLQGAAIHLLSTLLLVHLALTSAFCCPADYSQLGDFEVTTPIADLLQEIEAEGVPTSEDQACFPFYLFFSISDLQISVVHYLVYIKRPGMLLLHSDFLAL